MRLVFRGIFAAAKGHARRRLCRRKRESRKGKGLLNFCLNFNKKGTELRTFFRILVKYMMEADMYRRKNNVFVDF